MSTEADKQAAVKDMIERSDMGVTVTSVRDGFVLMFKKDDMRKLLDKSDNDKLIIFVQRPDVN